MDQARALAFAVELAVRSHDADGARELFATLEELVRRTPSPAAQTALAEARTTLAEA